MTQPIDPRPTWAAFPHEVWFTRNGMRSCRACREPQERDEFLAMIADMADVVDVEVIDREAAPE